MCMWKCVGVSICVFLPRYNHCVCVCVCSDQGLIYRECVCVFSDQGLIYKVCVCVLTKA